jgi:hypothetical protein
MRVLRSTKGEGRYQNQRINPMQSRLPMHHSRGAGRGRGTGARAGADRPLLDARRACRQGAPKGSRNDFKHGRRHTAGAILLRRTNGTGCFENMKACARRETLLLVISSPLADRLDLP